MRIELERLRADLETLADFGRCERPGINRVSFSPADMAGRAWFLERLQAAGLEAHMDGAGNVCGLWAAGGGARVMSGSHLDTVPQGGLFDGALGACAALECVRALKQSGFEPARPVEVVGTAEEEGRFGGMFGSQALAGRLSADWIEAAESDAGERLVDALSVNGLTVEGALAAARPPGSIKAFLELHIEQGPLLEARGLALGVVEGVSGVFNWTVRLHGRANHSGTTPMELRADAFAGLADFAAGIPALIAEVGGPQTRITVGRVELQPGYAHTIPGRAEFALVVRDLEEAVMDRLSVACRRRLEAAAQRHGLRLELLDNGRLEPTACDPGLVRLLTEEAQAMGHPALAMPSGAGHDAQTLSHLAPAGLIFVPSRGGVSHAPEEWTDWSDVLAGTELLGRALRRLASA